MTMYNVIVNCGMVDDALENFTSLYDPHAQSPLLYTQKSMVCPIERL